MTRLQRNALAVAIIAVGFAPTAFSASVNFEYYSVLVSVPVGLLMACTDIAAPLCLRRRAGVGMWIAGALFVALSIWSAYANVLGARSTGAEAARLAADRVQQIDTELTAINAALNPDRSADADAAIATLARMLASAESAAEIEQLGGVRRDGTLASRCPIAPPTADRCPRAHNALEQVARAKQALADARRATRGADPTILKARAVDLQRERAALVDQAAQAADEIAATAAAIGVPPQDLRIFLSGGVGIGGVALGVVSPLIALSFARALPPGRPRRATTPPPPAFVLQPADDRAASPPASSEQPAASRLLGQPATPAGQPAGAGQKGPVTLDERKEALKLHGAGYSQRQIAAQIGRSRYTIARILDGSLDGRQPADQPHPAGRSLADAAAHDPAAEAASYGRPRRRSPIIEAQRAAIENEPVFA